MIKTRTSRNDAQKMTRTRFFNGMQANIYFNTLMVNYI
nr:MAG TPA: hypothetical protein [Caudoviricetes sp.]